LLVCEGGDLLGGGAPQFDGVIAGIGDIEIAGRQSTATPVGLPSPEDHDIYKLLRGTVSIAGLALPPKIPPG